MIGAQLNHYRIVQSLGKGGMGEVFVAEDTKLDRRVALKILSAGLASDPGRRERFAREAKAIAALSHPNIVTVHSVEQSGETHFLTMELVEGRTLGDLIPPHGLPLDQVLKLAIPLADAVSAAHDRAVTHRDLKPANVMVASDGRVKVLDFGLAKFKESPFDPGSSVTALGADPLTGEGRIVGTVSYMSPEQAEGKPVDHRSDIFSLGIMLYEMATGERPFKGDSSLSILSAIVKDTPKPAAEINPRVPRELAKVIRRCLTKDPEHRFQSAKDLRNELEELKQELDSGELATKSVVTPAAVSPARRTMWMAGAAVLVLAALGLAWRFWPAPTASRAIEANFTQLTTQAGIESLPSVSPDGKWIVFTAGPEGNTDIMLQSVGGQVTINLTKDSPVNDVAPAFSPDGDRIAFRSARQGGGIFVMGRTGEFARRVTETGFNPAWSPDGTELAFVTEPSGVTPYGRVGVSELWIVKVVTGEKRLLSKSDAMQPHWSPNGRFLAYWAVPSGGSQRDIFTIAATGGTPVAITNDAPLDATPVWAPDGRFLYFTSDRGGSLNLWRIAVNPDTGAAAGVPEAITAPAQFVYHLSIAADGRHLVYSALLATSNIQKFAFDPDARAVRGDGVWLTSGSRILSDLHVSADGRQLVYRAGVRQEDLFISQADGTGERQLTNDEPRDRYPRWSPDGQRIAFYSDRSGKYDVWTIAPDGGSLRRLTDSPGTGLAYATWSPEGSRMVGTDIRKFSVQIFSPQKPSTEQVLETLPASPTYARFIAWSWSPDGQKLAGHESGAIVVYDFTNKAYRSVGNERGVAAPLWLSDSRRLLFSGRDAVFLADSVSGLTTRILSVVPNVIRSIGISPDGRDLYVVHGPNEADIWMVTLR